MKTRLLLLTTLILTFITFSTAHSNAVSLASFNYAELVELTYTKSNPGRLQQARNSIVDRAVSHLGVIHKIEKRDKTNYIVTLEPEIWERKDIQLNINCKLYVSTAQPVFEEIDFGKKIYFTGRVYDLDVTATSIECTIKEIDIQRLEFFSEYDDGSIPLENLNSKYLQREGFDSDPFRAEKIELIEDIFQPGRILRSTELCKFEKDVDYKRLLYPYSEEVKIRINFDNTEEGKSKFGVFGKNDVKFLEIYNQADDHSWFNGELKILETNIYTQTHNWKIELFCIIVSLEPFEDEKKIAEIMSGLTPIPYKENNCWGYRLHTGKMVFDSVYENAQEFSHNLAGVKVDGKWGFINKKGEMVIQPEYEDVKLFSDGLAPVARGNRWGYIDTTGKQVIGFRYSFAAFFVNGRAMVNLNGEKVFINKKGEVLK